MDNQFNNQTDKGVTPTPTPVVSMPKGNLKTNRSLLLFLIFSFITFGIYGIYYFTKIGLDINTVATRRDGRKTMHFCLIFFILSFITLGIADLVWFHRLSERVGNEARSRGIHTSFGAISFWLWNVIGSIIIIGPFVYLFKLSQTMNKICANYNENGI